MYDKNVKCRTSARPEDRKKDLNAFAVVPAPDIAPVPDIGSGLAPQQIAPQIAIHGIGIAATFDLEVLVQ
jgi:hypothetical protein